MMVVQFYAGSDTFAIGKDDEKAYLQAARFCDKDMARLRKMGDAVPHKIHANPALAEAKKRGVSLAGSGKVKPLNPRRPTPEELDAS